ncbi:MAG: hypothetical protein ACLU30_10925 [Odoribacter splanchnicus]
MQRSGEPGKDISEFWIRGMNTLVWVIRPDPDRWVERTSFNDLIIEDIAGFSVLKDASATASTAHAGHGVVLVRTKTAGQAYAGAGVCPEHGRVCPVCRNTYGHTIMRCWLTKRSW